MPENTPAAFSAAAAAGADWVELDVRRSADGVAVVHHDPRTSDGVPVVARSAAELAELNVPRLDSVLEALPPGLGADLEVKNLPGEPDHDETSGIAAVVAQVLRSTPMRPLLTSSFNPLTVAALTAAAADIPAGLVCTADAALPAAVEIAVKYGARALCPGVSLQLDAAGVAGIHAEGLGVLVWTVNDGEQARHLAAAGVDALCTDDPGRLLRALRSR